MTTVHEGKRAEPTDSGQVAVLQDQVVALTESMKRMEKEIDGLKSGILYLAEQLKGPFLMHNYYWGDNNPHAFKPTNTTIYPKSSRS